MKEMTREDKLYTMRMQELKMVADKLGIKINTKAAKSIAIEKILEAETKITPVEQPKAEKPEPKVEKSAEKPIEKPAEKPTAKRGEPLTYKGKSQNICAWAKELNKSPNTLYGRIYKLGWTIEKAFEK